MYRVIRHVEVHVHGQKKNHIYEEQRLPSGNYEWDDSDGDEPDEGKYKRVRETPDVQLALVGLYGNGRSDIMRLGEVQHDVRDCTCCWDKLEVPQAEERARWSISCQQLCLQFT